jgi:hypothetical protein
VQPDDQAGDGVVQPGEVSGGVPGGGGIDHESKIAELSGSAVGVPAMSVLFMIDTQRNMLQPPSPVPSADAVGKAISQVLAQARESGTQVIHIRNTGTPGDPDEPGTPDGNWPTRQPTANTWWTSRSATPSSARTSKP